MTGKEAIIHYLGTHNSFCAPDVPETPDGPHHYQRWKSTGIFPDTGRKADR